MDADDPLPNVLEEFFSRTASTPEDWAKHGANRFIRERDGTDPRERLTPDQCEVIWRLAVGANVLDVAAQTGVHPERISRWLKTPRFQRALTLERARPAPTKELGANQELAKEEH